MNINPQITIFDHVSFEDKFLFTKHLSVMLKSGIPLAESIEIIKNQANNIAFKKMLDKILKEVKNGQSLEVAISHFPKIFDALYINLIKIGEQSGNLEANLEHLALQMKKTYDFDKKIQAASIYPVAVILTAFVVGGGISIFVLPKLVELFKSMDVKLPLATRILLGISEISSRYGVFIFAGLILLFLLFRYFISLSTIKPKWHQILMKLPFVGEFIQNVQLALFCRNMGIMLKAGLPINVALQSETDSTTNMVFKEYYQKIQKGVAKGKHIAEEIEQSKFKYFPIIASKMIGVGEKTGKLEDSLLYLADYFEDEVDNTARTFSSVLEPLLLIGVGLVVAFVAFAIISPIYEFTGSIRR